MAPNINKLKDQARKFEFKEQLAKAIEVYIQILDAVEGTPEMDAEMGLFNKVGDLYLKTNEVNSAVEMYERAANRYVESGLPNNAIALCNKILRTAPGRTSVYLMLGELMLQRGFGGEAKQYLIEYARRMSKQGQVEEAFKALKKFADASPADQGVRAMLTEQLEAAVGEDPENEALAQLFEDFAGEARARASRAMRAPDTTEADTATAQPATPTGLVFIDLDADDKPAVPAAATPPAATPPPATPPAAAPPPAEESDQAAVEEVIAASLEIEQAAPEVELSEPAVAGLEGLAPRESDAAAIVPLEIETTSLDTDTVESVDILELEVSGLAGGDAVAPPAAPERTVEALEAMVAQNPDDGAIHRELAELLLESGERERGLTEFDAALEAFEQEEAWERARGVVEEILRLDPNSVDHHQKRVEYSYRNGEQSLLIAAYLDLANALFRSGSLDPSATVFERVLELDPENQDAIQALETLAPVELEMTEPGETAEPGSGSRRSNRASLKSDGFMDLGAFLDDEEVEKDSRMVGQDQQTGDEEGDFDHMLSQFKRGIEENIDEADSQAHYDLGVAFKEMGLLDEAIAEFQKALKGEDTRLQASEALGTCFFEKGQLQIAATVLRRAVDSNSGTDQDKIGLLYLLGRCDEDQSKTADALRYYQRVFAIDVSFQDVGERVDALAKVVG